MLKKEGNMSNLKRNMNKLKKVPKFKSENEEREFWSTHDSTEFIDYSKTKKALFPDLKPTTKTISIRLPVYLIEELKMLANKQDIPYQSLLKIFLIDKVNQELQSG